MKIKSLFLGTLILFCFACKPSGTSKKITVNTKLTAFSHQTKLDTFKIELKGSTSKEMSLHFTIITHNGIEIYKDELKANELLKNFIKSADIKDEAKKVKFLEDEVNYFFAEEHFLVPAVLTTEIADKNVPDKAFYEELKKSQLNGFSYRLSKDLNIYLAWSAIDKKVKVYYKCC
jgi:hypothetical protein